MDFLEFERQFKPSAPLPVYLIVAKEPFLARLALRMIREAKLGRTVPGLCLTRYSATQIPLQRVLDNCRTRPMFGPGQVVIVEEAEAFFEPQGKEASPQRAHKPSPRLKDNIERLISYLKSPSPFTCLVLIAGKVDERGNRFVRELARSGGVVECRPIYESRIPGWLIQRARGHNKRLDPAAAAALLDLVGPDLEQLERQLESLVLFVGESPQILPQHVDALVGADHARQIWELSDAVASGDVHKGITVLDRLLLEGIESVQIVSLLARELELMRRARALLTEGKNADEISAALAIHPFRARKLTDHARQLPEPELLRRTRLLLEVDLQTKTSAADANVLLETLIIKLCEKAR